MLVSGGAKGADTLFEELSENLGHKITIYKSEDISNVEILDKWLVHVNQKYLGRMYPTSSVSTNNLLRRNVKIALDADVMYAIGYISSDGIIEGGTAWACYIFIEKCMNIVGSKGLCDMWIQIPFHLFDQNKGVWYNSEIFQRKINFRLSVSIPKIKDISGCLKYGGIGSRNLMQNGIEAIRSLYV